MTDKIIINGVDVSGCELFDGSHKCICDKTGLDEYKKLRQLNTVKYVNCRDNYNCYYKQLKRKEEEYRELKDEINKLEAIADKYQTEIERDCLSLHGAIESIIERKEEECEKLKEKLKPKLKNAYCAYFEGQTGLCRAKEFKKCNPVNCKLYTVDELSTILDLQEQLQAEQQKVKELEEKLQNESLKTCPICGEVFLTPKGCELEEKVKKSDETIDNLLKIQYELAANCQKYTQALEEIKDIAEKLLKCVNDDFEDSIGHEILQKCEVLND